MKFFSKPPRLNDDDLLQIVVQNQLALAKKLEVIERKLDKVDAKQAKGFGDVVRGIFILYGKAVMARLNFMELSEGKPISASANEMDEIRNSLRDEPDPMKLILPIQKDPLEKPTGDFQKKRVSKLN